MLILVDKENIDRYDLKTKNPKFRKMIDASEELLDFLIENGSYFNKVTGEMVTPNDIIDSVGNTYPYGNDRLIFVLTNKDEPKAGWRVAKSLRRAQLLPLGYTFKDPDQWECCALIEYFSIQAVKNDFGVFSIPVKDRLPKGVMVSEVKNKINVIKDINPTGLFNLKTDKELTKELGEVDTNVSNKDLVKYLLEFYTPMISMLADEFSLTLDTPSLGEVVELMVKDIPLETLVSRLEKPKPDLLTAILLCLFSGMVDYNNHNTKMRGRLGVMRILKMKNLFSLNYLHAFRGSVGGVADLLQRIVENCIDDIEVINDKLETSIIMGGVKGIFNDIIKGTPLIEKEEETILTILNQFKEKLMEIDKYQLLDVQLGKAVCNNGTIGSTLVEYQELAHAYTTKRNC